MPAWAIALISSPPALAFAAWVVRQLVWDRLRALEGSAQRLGERMGTTEQKVAVLEARLQDVRDFSGVVRRDGE